MQPVPNQIRTTQTVALLGQIDAVLDQWRSFDFNYVSDAAHWEQLVRNIDRARRQFDSKLFFVVIFGPLKAGKSTLTNTLAGEYVSPSGFGKETTRRPSLVVHDEESGIDQYFSKDPEVNHFLSQRRLHKEITKPESVGDEKQKLSKVQEAFDVVADYLRGIRGKDELQGRIRIDTFTLNALNLEEKLTQELVTEPLLTVIRCKGGELLNHGVAVVDMPGLDGSRTNWRDDPIHGWVIQRAEFFLFVQSSVAALNNETHAFLQGVVEHSTKPPIWLIQNIFDARHWQPEETRNKQENDQREEGMKRITDLLNEAPRAVLGLNAGLAWDGKNEANNRWLDDSRFSKFEANLTKVLLDERALIQERNCLKYLSQRLDEAKEQLRQGAQNVEEVRQKHKQVRDELESKKAVLDAVNYRSDWESAVRGEIATIANTSRKFWLDSLDTEVANLRERLNRKRTGKEINGEIATVAARLAVEGDSKHFAKSSMLPQYIKLANQYCKSAENDAMTVCNQSLGSLSFTKLPDPLPPTVEDLPSLLQDCFTNDTLDEKKSFLGLGFKSWINKKHEGTTIGVHIEEVAKDWRQKITARQEGWVNQLLTNHFSTYCEKRRKHFRAHLQRLLDNYETGARPEEKAASAAQSLIEQMNEALRNLDLPFANAHTSMK